MTDIHKRTVTVNANGNAVISNLRVPFQRAEVVWVMTCADVVVATPTPLPSFEACDCDLCKRMRGVLTVEKPEKEEPEKVAIPKPPHRCPSCNNDSLETLYLDLQQYTFFCQKCGRGGPLFMTRGGL